MADDVQTSKGANADEEMGIKVDPRLQRYVKESHKSGFIGFESTSAFPSTSTSLHLSLWTSNSTNCLISQYRKYRWMIGPSTDEGRRRKMFKMISLEMQNCGYDFSPKMCEYRLRQDKLCYALYLKFQDRLKDSVKSDRDSFKLPKSKSRTISFDDRLRISSERVAGKGHEAVQDRKDPLITLLEKSMKDTTKHFALAERNKERRHAEKMAIRRRELDVMTKLLNLMELKADLGKNQRRNDVTTFANGPG